MITWQRPLIKSGPSLVFATPFCFYFAFRSEATTRFEQSGQN